MNQDYVDLVNEADDAAWLRQELLAQYAAKLELANQIELTWEKWKGDLLRGERLTAVVRDLLKHITLEQRSETVFGVPYTQLRATLKPAMGAEQTDKLVFAADAEYDTALRALFRLKELVSDE